MNQKIADRELGRDPRTNMFVMGTLYSGSGAAPVKIRDLSSTGARVEGGVLPPISTKVKLSRGALMIEGEVVWREGVRAGLKFAASASVADWLPAGRSQSRQRAVDELVQHVKERTSKPLKSLDVGKLLHGVSDPFDALVMLNTLAGTLANDAHVVAHYSIELQQLDLVSQYLRKHGSMR